LETTYEVSDRLLRQGFLAALHDCPLVAIGVNLDQQHLLQRVPAEYVVDAGGIYCRFHNFVNIAWDRMLLTFRIG
jgi:hypothetical protein